MHKLEACDTSVIISKAFNDVLYVPNKHQSKMLRLCYDYSLSKSPWAKAQK